MGGGGSGYYELFWVWLRSRVKIEDFRCVKVKMPALLEMNQFSLSLSSYEKKPL